MTHSSKIQKGTRFAFGKNWAAFLSVLSEERIREAEKSLKTMLDISTLEGNSFLDVGSGSGLFSLAARRLGARVHSFDYDPQSVACTAELKGKYFPNDAEWTIEQGNVLDVAYLEGLGRFDVVYSWGVLHHTGDMWQAMENIVPLVAGGGRLFYRHLQSYGRRQQKMEMDQKDLLQVAQFAEIAFCNGCHCSNSNAVIPDLHGSGENGPVFSRKGSL